MLSLSLFLFFFPPFFFLAFLALGFCHAERVRTAGIGEDEIHEQWRCAFKLASHDGDVLGLFSALLRLFVHFLPNSLDNGSAVTLAVAQLFKHS